MDKPLYEQIEDDIKELISSGAIPVGDKIPSVADIRKKYDVSHITALRALKRLASENYVEFVKGKGYFAKQLQDKTVKPLRHSIACMLRPYRAMSLHDNYFNEINQSVQRECMLKGFDTVYPKCNIALEDHYPQSKVLEAITETMLELSNEVDGFFIDERIPDSILEPVLDKTQKPFVIINRSSSLAIDSVSPDNINGAKKAAEMSLKMTYENFILCIDLNNNIHNSERINSFREILLENGVNEDRINEVNSFVGPFEDTLEDVKGKLSSHLKNLIFTPDDSLSRFLVDSFVKMKIKLGIKTGVLGFNGTGYTDMKKPFLATVNIHPENIGPKAVEVLLGKINGSLFQSPCNYTVPSTLSIGDTL